MGSLNIRSCEHKIDDLIQIMAENSISVMFLCETWHDTNSPGFSRLRSLGYSVADKSRPRPLHCDHMKSNHGGVAVVTSNGIVLTQLEIDFSPSTFEYVCARMRVGSTTVLVTAIYRTGHITTAFYDDLRSLISQLILLPGSMFIVGDINIHLNRPNDKPTRDFMHVIDSFALLQHVEAPTHQLGGLLDVVITDADCRVLELRITETGLSDHALIHWTTNIGRRQPSRIANMVRSWKKLDTKQFTLQLETSDLSSAQIYQDLDINSQTSLYHNTIKRILDDLIPLHRVCNYRDRSTTSIWFDMECLVQKRLTRRFERLYRQQKISLEEWRIHLRSYRRFLHQKCCSHWRKSISDEQRPRNLWKLLNHILGRCPSQSPSTLTPDVFAQYLTDKMSSYGDCSPSYSPCKQPCTFNYPSPILSNEIYAAIKQLPCKQNRLDPMPTWLLKYSASTLLPFLTNLFNKSLSNGIFPDMFKEALITPILKGNKLPTNEASSHRNVSGLSTVSKLLERCFLKKLLAYLEGHSLLPETQSAYRAFHSTETAVTKVLSDALQWMDIGKVTLLTLLDMSAAFDRVNHNVLCERLEVSFGIKGTPLNWIRSYLSLRKQTVVIGQDFSRTFFLNHGVPQGSVLGPILFLLYIADLETIVYNHNLQLHQYADDLQIYSSTEPTCTHELTENVISCVQDVTKWMIANGLSLNMSKTEIIWLVSPRLTDKFQKHSITINGTEIHPCKAIRDLGAHIDTDLTLRSHVSKTSSTCYGFLRRLRIVKRYIPNSALRTLVVSCVLSRLDYCNSILYGAPDSLLKTFQTVMNTSARLITGLKRRDRISPTLAKLHWLRPRERIAYKIALLTYKGLNSQLPVYLSSSLVRVSELPSRRALRSYQTTDLVIPRVQHRTFAGRAFPNAASQVWNNLPPTIRDATTLEAFKAKLKTYLFTVSHSQLC